MLQNRLGNKDKAEQLLREVVTANPELYDVAYSLGLLLAEEKKYDEAVLFLEKAAKGLPGRARVHYNLGLLLASLGKDRKAEKSLGKALEIDPDNRDYLFAAADYYLKRKRFMEAKPFADRIISKHPDWEMGYRLLGLIDKGLQGE
jgi:tetratricopeptide (TPR) repeat protein